MYFLAYGRSSLGSSPTTDELGETSPERFVVKTTGDTYPLI
jgi:hypothetical protein